MKLLRQLMAVSALLAAVSLPAQSTSGEVYWSFGTGKASPTTAEVSIDNVVSSTSYSCGSNVYINSTRTENGTTMSSLKVTDTTGSGENYAIADNAITFSMIPKQGVTFTPTLLEFNACHIGTDGGNIYVDAISGSASERIVTNLAPARNDYTAAAYPISSIGGITERLDIVFYITNLNSSKEIGLGQIKITGTFEGEPEQVASYTLSLYVGTEGAGSVSCNPTGNQFDAGTPLTVTADENFGYHFVAWIDEEGSEVSTDNPYSFEISKNTSLTAIYSQNNVYALNLSVEGGANDYLVSFLPEGNIVDGVHYYEEGTEVRLTTSNNRILTFTSWEDNSTSPMRAVTVNSDMSLTASYSSVDYIVGWDFYYDQPSSERAADYKAESDNAGLLSLHNASGATTSWLTRGISNGQENGQYGARIWKTFDNKYYFEASFSSVGYTDLVLCADLGVSYNTYSTVNVEYSIDGSTYEQFGTYALKSGWTSGENALPAAANGQNRLYVRFMPDYDSALVGATGDYDGLCISNLFILANSEQADDTTAPRLTTSIPANGDTGASATGSIILTFDEKVQAGTGNATLNGEEIAATFSGKSVVYSYSGLDYATEYTFNVPAGAITDRSGNAYEGTTIAFTTMERAQPEARLFDAIVAADGTGDHSSLQDAIDAAPSGSIKPYLIFVKNGEYKEHINIPASKPFMHIIGQDRDKAVILDDQLCGGDNAVSVSVGATVVVNANDCLFENITLENSWGHEQLAGPQALALNTAGDRTIFNNVAMLSYQDTWITPSTSAYRAYVRNSFIEGAVDFIYNSGDIYIDNTTLYIVRSSGGYIVAPSHAADVKWGYVFNNCTITAPGDPTQTSVWLGRPWHNYPKTVFLNTRAEVTIYAAGWYETMGGLPVLWADWNTTDINGNPVDTSQRRDTYYYTDSDGNKVYGTAKNYLTDEEAAEYTVKNVLSGSDNWQPVIKTESCATPVATISDDRIVWEAVPYAICYLITCDDEVVGFTTDCSYSLDSEATSEYCIQAVNEYGGLSEKTKVSNQASGIHSAGNQGEAVIATTHFNLQGQEVAANTPGICIRKTTYVDGTVLVEKILNR